MGRVKEVVLPKGLIEIDSNAFKNNYSVEKIILKEGTSLVVPEDKWGAKNAEIIYEP